jgi:tetratricopeptide (TPR) repeat protein
VGRELNVAHILEGSVRKSGNKIRITAQLIEVDSDAHLWSETWDRDLDDVFAIQDEIAARVVDELRLRLLGELPHAIETDGESYTLYLQARHTINQRTRESLMRGEELVKQALEIDPDYAPGWVLQALIYSQQGDVGARMPLDVRPLARAAVDRALELDPNSAAARALSGDIMISYDGSFAEARAEFERAIELGPNNVDVLYHAAMYYAFIGDPETALRLSLEALELDPLFTANHAVLGYIYGMLGQHEAALDILEERAAIAPESYGTYYYIAIPLAALGRYEEALEWIRRERLDGFRYTAEAVIYWRMGERVKSDEALANLLAAHTGGWDWQVVQARAVRGEIDEAFEAMEAAYVNRDSGLQLILGDSHIESLRDDPRYDAMVEKMGIRVD